MISLNVYHTYGVELKAYCSYPSDPLARLVEHRTSKPKVPGSNPGWSVDFSSLTVVYVMCGGHLNL